MMYLTGATRGAIEDKLIAMGAGFMWNPRHGHCPDRLQRYPAFACDNGCYAAGDRFDADRWLKQLEGFIPFATKCLFVVAPDVVGDAAATWERSRAYLPVIREMGFPAAFVSQDGQDKLPVPWDAFDCLFTGGSTAWKLSEPAFALVAEAKRRGKWTHMGRVNSRIRFRAAYAGGYDSCDGTYVAFNPRECVERLQTWQAVKQQRALWDAGAWTTPSRPHLGARNPAICRKVCR
jgi:hypothetical protein